MNTTDMNATVLNALHVYLGVDSPYRGFIMAVTVLLFLIALRKAIGNRLIKTIMRNTHKAERAEQFLRLYRVVWTFIISVLVMIAATWLIACSTERLLAP